MRLETGMNKDKITLLLHIMKEVTELPNMTWQEKRDFILGECNSDEQVTLLEFCGWFEEPEDE